MAKSQAHPPCTIDISLWEESWHNYQEQQLLHPENLFTLYSLSTRCKVGVRLLTREERSRALLSILWNQKDCQCCSSSHLWIGRDNKNQDHSRGDAMCNILKWWGGVQWISATTMLWQPTRLMGAKEVVVVKSSHQTSSNRRWNEKGVADKNRPRGILLFVHRKWLRIFTS